MERVKAIQSENIMLNDAVKEAREHYRGYNDITAFSEYFQLQCKINQYSGSPRNQAIAYAKASLISLLIAFNNN